MAKEDYLLRISILQEESRKMQEQVEIINQQTGEFEMLKASLGKIDGEKTEEILSPLGRGIYIKSKPLEKDLFVNIGCNIVLKKNPEETGKIIDRQIKSMEDMKKEMIDGIEKINVEFRKLIVEAQKKEST